MECDDRTTAHTDSLSAGSDGDRMTFPVRGLLPRKSQYRAGLVAITDSCVSLPWMYLNPCSVADNPAAPFANGGLLINFRA